MPTSPPWAQEPSLHLDPTSAHPQQEQHPNEYFPVGNRLNIFSGSYNSRKPTPSPLQVSQSSPTTANGDGPNCFSQPKTARRYPASSSQSSPHSPRSPTSANQDRPLSPKDRLDKLIASETSGRDGSMTNSTEVGSRTGPASAPAKTGSYHQLRNISSPVPLSKSLGSSPPASPVRTASTPFLSGTIRPDLRSMPRTSSIDSAISTISSATSHSHKSSQDSGTSTNTDITHLINTAGSAEALIQHLLREKQSAAAQNAQLWKLVDKQRTLVLGLNQDLERALKDKDRYRKKLKEHIAQIPPVPSSTTQTTNTHTRAGSGSPIDHVSYEETAVQRNKDRDTVIHDPRTISGGINDNSTRTVNAVHKSDVVAAESAQQAHGSASKNGPDAGSHTSTIDRLSSNGNRSERSLAPIQTTNLNRPRNLQADVSGPASVSHSIDAVVSPNSFTRKRSLPFSQKAPPNPSFQLTESTPIMGANEWQPPPRKLPPAPLNLRSTPKEPQYGPEDHSGSEYEDSTEADELPAFERGRKKTREEDDRERELALLKDQEDRSRSKKSTKGSKPPTEPVPAPTVQLSMPPAIKGLAPEQPADSESSGYLATPASLAGVLSPPNNQSTTMKSKTLSALPISPGLPVSPRPVDRPLKSPTPRMPRDGTGAYGTSPPLSPRNGFVGLPLSPRAPRQPIPMPPHTPMSIVSPCVSSVEPQKEPATESHGPKDHLSKHEAADDLISKQAAVNQTGLPKTGGVFRGFISDSYPDLLIPPNALPSISVKVNSSRLKPSRHSYLGHRASEEESVFTLGISARSDMRELWQVEKPITSLPSLDHEIRKTTAFEVKLPDRSLFSGHAPAKMDARRVALERYFEMVLDTPMDEKAAVALCRYLSAHAIEPTGDDTASIMNMNPGSPVKKGPDGRLVKEGYLTKRGKNFGGWKARFFVLDEPILRYYESPGGTLLGTIKLHNAQIGKQSSHQSSSPSRNADDSDNQYRHAFLILEPKRKDSNSFVRHVLCAENDAERDVWVEALLFYVEEHAHNDRVRPVASSTDSTSSKLLRKQIAKKDGANADSPESATFEGLQALSYDSTIPAQPPVISILPQRTDADTPSPPLSDNVSAGRASQASKPISGPSNGAKIEDAGAWGNKIPQAKDLKEPKKRGIWGFRDRNPDLTAHADDTRMSFIEPPPPVEINPNARPMFGVPLAEAVEFCSPKGVDVSLPAVVYRCLEYLEAQDAASEEGIFRLSGSSVVIKALRDRFNNQGDFDFLADGQYYDVHAVASLLKLYLRELPSTVLTRELHLDFLSVLELDSRSKKIAAYNMLAHRLPRENWTLLRALSAFLIGIIHNSDVNKMSVRNVGIVFSPTLNIPAPVFSMFLTEFDAIFSEGPEQTASAPSEVAVHEPLTPEDIRSPRRQIFSDIPTPSYSQSNFPQAPNRQPQAQPNPTENDTGFVSLRPSYEGQVVPGPEPSLGSRNLAPDGAVKARRRESSMLLMSGNQRKSSMPLLRGDSGSSSRDHIEAYVEN
ncbi:MAG: hypothetical protein L6R41_000014 [Letrouitia leprolyta]|nr:MAG: hypothetical protein L6R41_000014 [Letrouitia leprolyta]